MFMPDAQPRSVETPDAQEAQPISSAQDLTALTIATAAGDRRAFRALYEATCSRLFGVALLVVKDRSAAEEVLQDAYVRVWVEARRYDPERGHVMPWLRRIVLNLAIDHLRRHRRPHEDIAEQSETLVDPGLPVDQRGELSRRVHRLGPDHREALTLTYVYGYTNEEIAERLGVPLGTVKSRIRRGLSQLREAFCGVPLEGAAPLLA
jgi:RNA polymerase sigma-70 factor (ECF subfamily)